MFSGFELYSMADLNSETPLYPGSLYSVRFSRDVNKRVLWMMCFRNDEILGWSGMHLRRMQDVRNAVESN